MKLISSGPALDLVLALTQRREGARLAELAAACELSLSTAQTAMRLLVSDGIVAHDGEHRPRYRLRAEHRASDAIERLAARYAAPRHALDVVVRANPSVEFAARDRDGYVVVEHPVADPRDLAALERIAGLIGAGGSELRMTRYAHHDLVDRLRDDVKPRRRAEAATPVKGSLARSFSGPAALARRSKGSRRSRPVRVPARALAAIARAHHLQRIRLFGSAARGSLGPSSDLDVLVEPRSDAGLSLLDLARLEGELEGVFDRHVDIATPGNLGPKVRERIEREAVTLFGRP
ncbi:MAG TPA: nucleotidyltransferase domain-containing protein [Candidatus Limnocylindria bacterium]|nr:nucleotidyltransferase domain-containing protein [Candidatus Limnocylindria bacterium]